MPHSKQRYDIAVCWEKKSRRGSAILHTVRALSDGGYSLTACGKSHTNYGSWDIYVNAHWHVRPTNVHIWCEKCRSAAIAALPPYSNTGAKLSPGGQESDN